MSIHIRYIITYIFMSSSYNIRFVDSFKKSLGQALALLSFDKIELFFRLEGTI
jgi:hypothetical protein